jgi:DNA modification methylase
MIKVLQGDCREILATMPDCSVDSIVTDPPYGLSFMGKHWDYDVPGVDIWRECLRVLKPGGHLLSFAGTRTQHRMAVNIEDAGFEIRDMIAWVYGSGFPKSKNVALSIDKGEGHPDRGHRIAVANRHHPDGTLEPNGENIPAYEAKSEAGRKWQGWGTALKPAMEPITMARKPLAGTVAVNVLAHGTGGINIDGCRVGSEKITTTNGKGFNGSFEGGTNNNGGAVREGRWPANLIHDGSEEVVGLFPNAGNGHWSYKPAKDGGIYKYGLKDMPDGGSDKTVSSAARFFYCAKASRSERNAGLEGMPEKRPDERTNTGMGTFVEKGVAKQSNHHPTVKPIELMRYLVRLVTPPGGIVLDPFAGSGSTGVACAEEGFGFIGIEREAEYCEIARARIENRGGLFCTSNATGERPETRSEREL